MKVIDTHKIVEAAEAATRFCCTNKNFYKWRTQYAVNFFLINWLTYCYGAYFLQRSSRNWKIPTPFDSLNVFFVHKCFKAKKTSILLKKYNPLPRKFLNIENRWNWDCSLRVSKQRLIRQFAKKIEISRGIGGRRFCQKWPKNRVFGFFSKKILLLQGWILSYLEQFFNANTMALAVFPNRTCHPPKSGFQSYDVWRDG